MTDKYDQDEKMDEVVETAAEGRKINPEQLFRVYYNEYSISAQVNFL